MIFINRLFSLSVRSIVVLLSGTTLVVYLIVSMAPQPSTDYIVLNRYDDSWEDQWITHLQSIYRNTTLSCGTVKKTPGFIVHLGDSMTYASHYGAVSEYGVAEFEAIIGWSQSLGGEPAAADNKNGWQLASFDHPSGGRSYTAVSGITAHQYLYGQKGDFAGGRCDRQPLLTLLNNRSTEPLPLCSDQPNPPKVAIIHDSIIAVILLGSNDIFQGRSAADIYRDLKTIVQHLEKAHIMPVLTTIPLRLGLELEVIATNRNIMRLAREQKLPVIGFWQEVIRRQPGFNWYGTLISADGVHPTAATSYRDPSIEPGILNESGYLLRSYLTLLKLKEIKDKVIDTMAACD